MTPILFQSMAANCFTICNERGNSIKKGADSTQQSFCVLWSIYTVSTSSIGKRCGS
jgi:hypothetical protein